MKNAKPLQSRRLFIVALLVILVVAIFLVSRVTKKHDAKELPKKTTVKPTPQDQNSSQ